MCGLHGAHDRGGVAVAAGGKEAEQPQHGDVERQQGLEGLGLVLPAVS